VDSETKSRQRDYYHQLGQILSNKRDIAFFSDFCHFISEMNVAVDKRLKDPFQNLYVFTKKIHLF